jgi:heat shock protein HslJ
VTETVTEQGVPRPLVRGTRLRLSFPPGRVTVEAGCNTMNADMPVGPEQLVVGDLASTLMACEPERERQDRMVADFLTACPAWALTAAGLTLSTDGLRFDLTEEPGGTPRLWGRSFVAIAVNESGIVPAQVVEGTEIVLTFTDPYRLTAQAGCNVLGFEVAVGDFRLAVSDDFSSTDMACTPELMAQDEWLAAFLVDDPAYTYARGTLTLTRASTEIVLVTKPQS